MYKTYEQAIDEIIKAGNRLDKMNLAPATSGNYSVRVSENKMAITVSGVHKGQLEQEQIMKSDIYGNPLEDNKKPSAETLLHCQLYKLYPEVNAVLHTHSVACSVITRLLADDNELALSGYEMLKAYSGVDTHDISLSLPIFNNTQDMRFLSSQVEARLKKLPEVPAYLIRSHGIYGWGYDMDEAMRVIEATEMMMNCEMNIMRING